MIALGIFSLAKPLQPISRKDVLATLDMFMEEVKEAATVAKQRDERRKGIVAISVCLVLCLRRKILRSYRCRKSAHKVVDVVMWPGA